MYEISSLAAKLDAGPKMCRTTELTTVLAADKTCATNSNFSHLSSALQFAKPLKAKARELCLLLRQYAALARQHKDRHISILAKSIAQWIFLTNEIEHAGLATEEETAALIRSQRSEPTKEGEADVLYTLQLIRHVGKDPLQSTLQKRVPTYESVCEWHNLLFGRVHPDFPFPGQFRQRGAMTTSDDEQSGSEWNHIYPHHTIIVEAMKSLSYIA
jgi:hypothetical protein